MLVIYEAVEGMTKTAKGAIRLPYDDLSAYDAFEVLAPGLLFGFRKVYSVFLRIFTDAKAFLHLKQDFNFPEK